MQIKSDFPVRNLKLNGQRRSWDYTAIFENRETIGKKETASKMVWEFTLEYFGMVEKDVLRYTLKTKRRLFLNERDSAVRKLNKAQAIALKAASINDEIQLLVSKNFKLLEVINTEQIRARWEEIKSELLEEYPDLAEMAGHLDWQLQDSEIQQLFLTDNFYNFLFANVFYQDFETGKEVGVKKIISNCLGNLDLPILEQKVISKQDIVFDDIEITAAGEIDTASQDFKGARVNAFLGKLVGASDASHTLSFKYKGIYKIKPKLGLITAGTLAIETGIKDVYTKNINMSFKLENYGG